MSVARQEYYQKAGIKNPEGSYDFFFHAIENADGVPFQLIFGPAIGEGYYLNIGSGIHDLLGVEPEFFSEKLFHSMIEEVVTLSDNMPSDPEVLRRMFLNGEIKTYKAEVLVKTATGEKKWIRDASLPLYDEETGKVIGAFGILYDISASKNSDSIIKQARKSADEYDRLKSAFLHNISHEIRTPLNAIVGFSTLLSEAVQEPEQQQEYMGIITRSTDHLLEVLTGIMEMSKIESGSVKVKSKPVDPDAILRKAYSHHLAGATEKGIFLCYETGKASGKYVVFSDDNLISQVLDNLVDNALKFTRSGKVVFGYEIKRRDIEFYVQDTGVGIAPEYHDIVFSKFFRTDNDLSSGQIGIGLGLALSKAYVELLGGKIWFSSLQGQGSDFRFSIPLREKK